MSVATLGAGRGGRWRRWVAKGAIATTFVVGLGLGQAVIAPSAQAKAPTAKTAVTTQRMSGPSLKTKQVGWYSKGKTLSLVCYERGQSVQGYYSPWFPGGWDNIWYKVSDGYWVADIDINTGSNSPVTSKCGSSSSTTLSAKVDAFRKTWLGKTADYDKAYGGQCVDLFNYYNRDVVKARRPAVAYAYQLYDTYDSSKYTRVSKSSTPRKGDVAVWASNLPYSGGAGHVAIVLGTSGSNLVVLQQNYNGIQRVIDNKNLSKSYLRGYLRPKG